MFHKTCVPYDIYWRYILIEVFDAFDVAKEGLKDLICYVVHVHTNLCKQWHVISLEMRESRRYNNGTKINRSNFYNLVEVSDIIPLCCYNLCNDMTCM